MNQPRPQMLVPLALACALFAAPATLGATEPAEVLRGMNESVAAHSGDLSLLVASASDDASAALRGRPDSLGLVQVASRSPALRIHYAQGPLSGLLDADLDGIPDRVLAARQAAQVALRVCGRLGLEGPGDDGDGEVDIYLVPLGGLARGYAAIEGALPPTRGGYGFAVADPSSHFDEHAFKGMVARSVARLVLAAADASAPDWWTEASSLWIEERANGAAPDIAQALHARWSRPEIGLSAGMPALIRGNAGLLWALDDPAREAAVMRATWAALAARDDSSSADELVLATLERAARMSLEDLQLRAGIRQLVHGQRPLRWALDIGPQGLADDANIWVAPRGAALVRLAGGSAGEATRLALGVDGSGWKATLVAHRRAGGWDRISLVAAEAGTQVLLPWDDYHEAVLLLATSARRSEGGAARVSAEAVSRGALFGLASFAARRTPMGGHAIQWESTWEDGLFGWLVERSLGAEGPWAVLSEIPLPSLGDERSGSSYTLHDPERARGEALRYRLVGVTADGLRVSGPTLVAQP